MKHIFISILLLVGITNISAQDNLRSSNIYFEHGKTTFLISNDNESVSSNLLDVLQKYPYIAIDEKGIVTLNGSPDFGLCIDGQFLNVEASTLCSILRNMPARGIEKVEIMVQPSTSLLISCSAGVINIITKKSKVESSNFSIGAKTNSNGFWGGDALVNFKHKNISINGCYSVGLDNNIPINEESKSFIIDKDFLYLKGQERNYWANLNGSWQISANDLLKVSFNSHRDKEIFTRNESFNLNITDVKLQSPNSLLDIQMMYSHKFTSFGAIFTLQYSYDKGSLTGSNLRNTVNQEYNNTYLSDSKQDFFDKSHSVIVDFSLPIGTYQQIKFGGKYLKDEIENIQAELYYQNSKCVKSRYSNFKINNEQWNSFLEYSLKFKKLQLTTAIRTEESPKYSYLISSNKTFFLPSINLMYQLTNSSYLSADYSVYLSSKYWKSNDGMLPYTADAVWNNMDTDKKFNRLHVGYNMCYNKLTLLFDALYSFGDNRILRNKFLVPFGSDQLSRIDHINEDCSFKRTNVSLALGYQFIPAIRVQVSSGIGYYDQDVIKREKTSQSGFDGYTVLSSWCNLPYGFTLNMNGGYYFPRFLYGDDSSAKNSFYRFRLSRNILNNKLTLSLYANDFAKTDRRASINLATTYYPQSDNQIERHNFYKETGHEVGVSMVYRF